MVWSRQAKVDFYWSRRRAAVKKYQEYAETLGTSKKRAKTKAIKDTSKELAARKQGFKEINRRDKQIRKLADNPKLTKAEERKLEKLLVKQDTQVAKVNERWAAFEERAGFEPIGADSERSQRNT